MVSDKIGVVLVTYNRSKMLIRTLEAFEKQSMQPKYIIVVNNASTDDTADFLKKWKKRATIYKKIVIHNEENLGGSGGFNIGLSRAQKLDANWIWVSDDDAIPAWDAIELADFFLDAFCDEKVSAICGQVINHGKIDTQHRKRYKIKGAKVIDEPVPKEEYENSTFELNAFSYVGTIINRKKLEICGLTRSDYFIWFDDTEHSLRLSEIGKIICVTSIKITHDVMPKVETKWKYYYGIRNRADMYKNHFPYRCYFTYRLSMILRKSIKYIFNIDREIDIMMLRALQDCKNGCFGRHKIYQAGWKPKEQSSLKETQV